MSHPQEAIGNLMNIYVVVLGVGNVLKDLS